MTLLLENAPWCGSPAAPVQPAMALQRSVGSGISPPRRQGPICKMQKHLVPFSGTARGSRVGARTDGCLSPASAAKAERAPERGWGLGGNSPPIMRRNQL